MARPTERYPVSRRRMAPRPICAAIRFPRFKLERTGYPPESNMSGVHQLFRKRQISRSRSVYQKTSRVNFLSGSKSCRAQLRVWMNFAKPLGTFPPAVYPNSLAAWRLKIRCRCLRNAWERAARSRVTSSARDALTGLPGTRVTVERLYGRSRPIISCEFSTQDFRIQMSVR
jgi:hypothetical protein